MCWVYVVVVAGVEAAQLPPLLPPSFPLLLSPSSFLFLLAYRTHYALLRQLLDNKSWADVYGHHVGASADFDGFKKSFQNYET